MSGAFDKLLAKGKAKLSEFTGPSSGSHHQQGYPGQGYPGQQHQQGYPPPQGYPQAQQGYPPPNPGQYSGAQYPPQYPPQNQQWGAPPQQQQWNAPQQQQWGPPPPQQQSFGPPPIPQGSKPHTPQPGSPPPIPQNRPPSAQPPPPQNIPPPHTEKVYWRPSFDKSTPVSQNFRHEIGDHGWGNNEKQMYTDSPENSFHHDNRLIVRALVGPDKWTSARLTSHQTLSRPRGYLSATCLPPSAPGIWPAYWMLPADPFKWPTDGEVDIAESWNAETENHSCLHWGSYTGEDAQKHRVVKTSLPDLARQPHTYGFAWIEEEGIPGWRGRMIWYIDGRPVMKGSIPEGTRRMEDFRILINIAMGGTVNQGKLPAEGYYDFVVSDMKMCEEPVGGWHAFERDWGCTPEGKAL
ncbi:glycoside hydrolase family 16 protein [Bipolaris oryzae ATCC 44560]|uniref:Glycoside hydrolase family 16 protein n=1 Tax=Bipolaris oryzae ATCC 44560 TaxID=930090 RepID=W6Z4G7_COCMI|nr:glycoside hydrolase family 16 protein [Bipolaris oryzae ATCC 44560]EUC44835.1 glycoside hydrolase family 16 protein [Bipolaris oryzae ATCC 44560]